MDEDSFHKATSAHERWVLCFDTSESNIRALWEARDELERLLHQHWHAIEFDTPPKVVQIMQPQSASVDQLAAMMAEALNCGVFILYAGTRVVMLLNHSVVSGHLGCKLTSWVSTQEWSDKIGMPTPGLFTELMATMVGAWRITRVPIMRNFWLGGEVKKLTALAGSDDGQASTGAPPTKYACHFDVDPGTHPQAVMHQVLTRVTEGWRVAGQPASWCICSAAPFKEIRGVANNVGVMNYTFPIEPACTVRELRDELGYAKWQVVLSAAANRTFASAPGVSIVGSLMSKIIPDMSVGRGLLDAVFSFMVMNLSQTDAVHLYSTSNQYSGSRQKAFIAAAYDKATGRVHVTLSVNPSADEAPDEARLQSAGLEPFERFGPFDASRLGRSSLW